MRVTHWGVSTCVVDLEVLLWLFLRGFALTYVTALRTRKNLGHNVTHREHSPGHTQGRHRGDPIMRLFGGELSLMDFTAT